MKVRAFWTVSVVTINVALVITACGRAAVPTTMPTTAPTDVPDSTAVHGDATTYTSPHYGYAVNYPTTWVFTPETRDWPAYEGSYPDEGGANKWTAPTSDPWILLFVVSQPLDQGQSASARIAHLDRENADNACHLGHRHDVTIGGVAARQEDGTCFGKDYISEIALVHSGRFYFIYLLSGSAFSDTTLATFDGFAKSFRFVSGS